MAWGQIYWRKMKKRFGKHGAAIQKQRTNRGSNCFHPGYVLICASFGILNRSGRWPTAGREETKNIVFSQPCKTPSESKKIENCLIVCWAGVGRFCCQPNGFVCFLDGAAAARGKKPRSVEPLERDLERGKPLFRRKKGKVRNLDGSGHKGLADYQCLIFRFWSSQNDP